MGLFGGKAPRMLWKVHDSLRQRGHFDLDPRVVDLARLPGYMEIGPLGVPRFGLSLDLAFRLQLVFFIENNSWGYCTLHVLEGPTFKLGDELEFNFGPASRDITYEVLGLIDLLRAN
jgi:hypothetical protein